MSDKSRALKYARECGENLTRDLKARLLGEDSSRVLHDSGHDTEFPEDVVIQLVRLPECDEKYAALAACTSVGADILSKLLDEKSRVVNSSDEWRQTVTRFCNVLDRAAPSALENMARAMLHISEGTDGDVRASLVRGALGYLGMDDLDLLRHLVETDRHGAAYAFHRLVKLGMSADEAEKWLAYLEGKVRDEKWTVDVAFLRCYAQDDVV